MPATVPFTLMPMILTRRRVNRVSVESKFLFCGSGQLVSKNSLNWLLKAKVTPILLRIITTYSGCLHRVSNTAFVCRRKRDDHHALILFCVVLLLNILREGCNNSIDAIRMIYIIFDKYITLIECKKQKQKQNKKN